MKGRINLIAMTAFAELLIFFAGLLRSSYAVPYGWAAQTLTSAAVIGVILLPFGVAIASWYSRRWAIAFVSTGAFILMMSMFLFIFSGVLFSIPTVGQRPPMGPRYVSALVTFYLWSPLPALLMIIPSGVRCLTDPVRLLMIGPRAAR